ncbi:MAG: hypothetical protein COV60_03280 [Candidatus Magasanikbacteria bacterium CG11_big_fil_rev_8_21_14_0_20_43_7]|uniref:Uncharacterized protein n=1 Tax=Candidatus Magasanikbacteria bacterium CG11_big_fil_rev_8_21_14_0_20_43_7 TaxID=1974654 RepID=A0A2H0N424_9BACT|nr:MAG: hypothetical protein COV60_03280 [Candidatus Magasanikbacteria bacterium CG11_big_fil_rev_8_21_14_0_20_43_7]
MTKKIIANILFLSVVVFVLFGTLQIVHAKKTISDAGSALTSVTNQTGVAKTDLPSVFATLIKGALQLVGIIFFILMFYAGFRWLTAAGEQDRIDSARKTLVAASVGLVIVVGSYAFTNFISTRIIQGEKSDTGPVDFENTDFKNFGCCFDKVRHPDTNPGELRATNWEWRIKTGSDCEEQGNKPASFDKIYGPGTWQFAPVDSKQQCENLYAEFCKTTKCYELTF